MSLTNWLSTNGDGRTVAKMVWGIKTRKWEGPRQEWTEAMMARTNAMMEGQREGSDWLKGCPRWCEGLTPDSIYIIETI